MKIRIVCKDGLYSSGDSGVFTEDGERIEGVRAIEWSIGPDNELAIAKITFQGVPADILGETESIKTA